MKAARKAGETKGRGNQGRQMVLIHLRLARVAGRPCVITSELPHSFVACLAARARRATSIDTMTAARRRRRGVLRTVSVGA